MEVLEDMSARKFMVLLNGITKNSALGQNIYNQVAKKELNKSKKPKGYIEINGNNEKQQSITMIDVFKKISEKG